jgi:hypothetical protein
LSEPRGLPSPLCRRCVGAKYFVALAPGMAECILLNVAAQTATKSGQNLIAFLL